MLLLYNVLRYNVLTLGNVAYDSVQETIARYQSHVRDTQPAKDVSSEEDMQVLFQLSSFHLLNYTGWVGP